MVIDEDDYLAHYGTPRRSGRYPWGSGQDEESHNKSLLGYISDLKKQGMSETDIAKGLGMSTTELRAERSIANSQKKLADIGMAQRLKDKGNSNVAIGQRMGINESSVRALLAPGASNKSDVLKSTTTMLKGLVGDNNLIDVGSGTEQYLGVSKEKLSTALAMLKTEGYNVHPVKETQLGTGLDTRFKVLAPPGVTQKEAWLRRAEIKPPTNFSDDGGVTFTKNHPPMAIDLKRVAVRYAEDGGSQADGVIYVRPGVKDVSLGKSPYAQVRVQVGDGHYLKGMAHYKDGLPAGTDLMFNTNKSDTGNKLDAMKELTADPDLPFGAITRQVLDHEGTPDERVTSVMNIVGTRDKSNEAGSWNSWSRSIAPQVLSKQSPSLIRDQLAITYESRKSEYEDILSLSNPTVKKKLLETFADGTDSAAVHLKAAALPRQNWHVILPIDSIKEDEIYAPGYRNGERVALIRYPHAGPFEIPELTVNNKSAEARGIIGNESDAIGIHHSVAQHLSGADFDGDTVIVIPNDSRKIKTEHPLQSLMDFNPQSYKIPKDSPIPTMKPGRLGFEMGDISNLITDMTIRNASHNDIARAVRHSMVVIDAVKHGLNYKQSALDNGIRQLKQQYQGRGNAGASTLISKAKSDLRIPDRKPRPQAEGGPIDKTTGRRVFVETGRMRTDVHGNSVPRTTKVEKLAVTDDAHTLSSGTPIEKQYADHSNKLKALANQARLSVDQTPSLKYSPSAKKVYANEVNTLNSKLTLAIRNRPRERQAVLLSNQIVRAKKAANPNIEKEELKKIKYQALAEARLRTGAQKEQIKITDQEWAAIQAGAISNAKLKDILDNSDIDVVRELATPKRKHLMTTGKTDRAKQMLELGYTRAEVADQLGVSLTTLDLATHQ